MTTGRMLLCLAVGWSSTAQAQESPPEHPINRALSVCLDKDYTTVGMIDCASTAYESWDDELNKQYRALLVKLSPADAAKLKDSQRKWLAFRDAEVSLIDSIYAKLEGTMWLPTIVMDKSTIIEERTLQLQSLNAKADERS